MVETISPVVYGSRRRYWVAVALHTSGAALSAGLLGAALGGLGALLGGPWHARTAAVIGLIALLYLARESLRLPIPIFDRRRQVPRWWRDFFSPNIAATLYGLSLGIGFVTFLSFGTFTAVAVSTVALADPLVGAIVCLPFGLARGLSVALSASSSTSSGARKLVERLETMAATRLPRALNSAVLLGIVVVAALAL